MQRILQEKGDSLSHLVNIYYRVARKCRGSLFCRMTIFFLIGISRRIQFVQFLVNKGNINKERKVIPVFEISSLLSCGKWGYTRCDL